MMQKHEKLALAAIREELDKADMIAEVLGHGGRTHLKIRVLDVTGGHVGCLQVASSPASRDHCVMRARKEARAITKANGGPRC